MQSKLKPGDTFPHEQDGVTYQIKVMSAGDQIDAEDALAALADAKSVTDHVKAWLAITDKHVVGWSMDEPLDRLRYNVTTESLGELLQAVMAGNVPSEDDLKN